MCSVSLKIQNSTVAYVITPLRVIIIDTTFSIFKFFFLPPSMTKDDNDKCITREPTCRKENKKMDVTGDVLGLHFS
jgi:hypothetical protein